MRLVRIRRRRRLRKLLLLWLRKLDVVRRWWTRSSYKFVEKSVTLRQFMFYASKFICSSLSCIFVRGLQGIDALASCCCSTCCCCLQYIDALFKFDNFGLSICKLLRTAVKITRETWKPLAFSTSDALCDELL